MCQKCTEIRAKEKANSKTKRKLKITITCKMCGNDFQILGNKNIERTDLATIPYCIDCQGKRREFNEIRKKRFEDWKLNQKLKFIRSSPRTHKLNSLAMEETELKKHLHDGDMYLI